MPVRGAARESTEGLAKSDPSLRMELLGSPRAWVDGKEVPLGPPLQCAVLVVLAMRANQVVGRAEIIDALWGDKPPATAGGSVHSYVAGLRRELEPRRARRARASTLVTTGPGYVLRIPSIHLDVGLLNRYRDQATRLQAAGDLAGAAGTLDDALALWRGTALASVPGPFADRQRARLAEMHTRLVEDRAELMLVLGNHRRVAVDLAAAVRAQPIRERPHALLMLAQYRSGRQPDALATFHAVRAALAAELGVEPGPELQRMHIRVLASDPMLDLSEPVALGLGATRGRGSRPAQMPHDILDFVGRADELAALRAALAGPPEQWLSEVDITGPGGVGKTALAVHFAAEIADRFPDGQLYLNLGGFGGPAPLSTQDAIGQLLRGLGLAPARVPADLAGRLSAYRSILCGRRVLILLDNAVGVDHVRELIPDAPGCVAMVTCRQRARPAEPVEGRLVLALDVLPEPDSVELLRRIFGSQTAAADRTGLGQLALLCGHLPLALRVAAERVIGFPQLTLADLVAELKLSRHRLDVFDVGEDDDLTTLRAVFSWSYSALKPAAARAYRLLGLHPGTEIGVGAAAALLGVDDPVALNAMRSLAADHLLEQLGPNRFRFHDLLRGYAGERAELDEPEASRYAARSRVARWYEATAMAAAAIVSPQRRVDRSTVAPKGCQPLAFDTHAHAVEWCTAEWQNLRTIVDMAGAAGEHGTVTRLVGVLLGFLKVRPHWSEWVEVARLAVDSAHAVADVDAEAAALSDLAVPLLHQGRLAEAEEALRRASALQRRRGRRCVEAMIAANLGVVLGHKGVTGDAIELLRGAIATFGAERDELALAHAQADLGLVLTESGRYAEAIGQLTPAIAVFRAREHLWGECSALITLGRAHRGLLRFDEANDCYDRADVICRETGDLRSEAIVSESLGDLAFERGDRNRAESYWRDSVTVLEVIGDPRADEVSRRVRAAGS